MNSRKMKVIPYLFIGPAILLLLVFSFSPIVISFFISFTDLDLLGLANWSSIEFNGIDNYIRLFQDKIFLQAIYNTFFYVIIGVPFVVGSSFIIAFFLNLLTNWLSSTFRIIFYMPSVTNIVAVA